ncbi:OmpA family protein [candidate division WOR-3 bacterium]|nr:OmpA family protein [candidate division WOR-3 bacterium]
MRWLLLTGLILIIPLTAFSFTPGEDAGTRLVTPFEIPVSARPMGMGDAFSCLTGDVNGLLYNPATLAFLNRPSISTSHNQYLMDTYQTFLSLGFPSGLGTIGVGILYFNEGDIRKMTNGVYEGTVKSYSMGGILGYSGRFHKYFALGLNGKFLYFDYAGYTATAVAGDIGLLVPPIAFANGNVLFSIGVCMQNFGTQVKFMNDAFDQPLNVKSGFTLQFPNLSIFALNTAVDINYPLDGGMRYNLGGELWVVDVLALRAGYAGGYDWNNADESGMNISYGAGVKVGAFQLDYAYRDWGEEVSSEVDHRLSLSFGFGRPRDAGPIKVLIEDEQYDRLLSDHEQIMMDITDIKMDIEELKGILETSLKTYITPDELLHLLNIHFVYGNSVVPKEEYAQVSEAARLIKTYYADKVVTIEGHCDKAGSGEANIRLSIKRAEAVRDILVGYGIAPDKIITVGLGEKELLSDRTGPGISGIENRRVVFAVIEEAIEKEIEKKFEEK